MTLMPFLFSINLKRGGHDAIGLGGENGGFHENGVDMIQLFPVLT